MLPAALQQDLVALEAYALVDQAVSQDDLGADLESRKQDWLARPFTLWPSWSKWSVHRLTFLERGRRLGCAKTPRFLSDLTTFHFIILRLAIEILLCRLL